MSGFAQVGQVLKMLDMVPDKKGKKTFIEKLPSAQKLDGGNMGGVMETLMKGGLGEIIKNPMAAIMGALQGLIGGMGGAQAAAGNPQTAAAAGQLATTLDMADLLARSLLSDVPLAEGYPTVIDMALHESVITALGDAAPPEIALTLARAPLSSGELYARIGAEAYTLNDHLLRGLVLDEEVAARLQAMNTEVAAMVNASGLAFYRADEIAVRVATVHAVAGLLVSGSDELKGFLRTIIVPEVAKAMDAALVDRLTIAPNDDEVPPADSTELTTCV